MVHGHSSLRVSEEATLLILLYSAGASHGHFVRYKSIMYSEMGCTASLGTMLRCCSANFRVQVAAAPRSSCSFRAFMPTRFKYMDGQAVL